MALFAPSPSAAPEPLKDLQQAGPSSPSAASAKENEDGQIPLSAPEALKKGLSRRRFSPARPLAASRRPQAPTARSTVGAGAAVETTAGKEKASVFEKARSVLIASNAIEKLAEVVSGKAPINPARRTPHQDAGTAAAASAADAAPAAAEATGATEGSGAAEGHRRFIPAGPRQGTGGSVFFTQQSPESRTTRRNSYVASTFSSPLLLLSPEASGSGTAGGAGSPPSTRRDNLLEARADEPTRRKALLPSEWRSPVAAAASCEPEQTEPAHAAAPTAAAAAAAAPAATAAGRRTAAAGTAAAEANATKESALSVVTVALGGEGEPRSEGGGASPGNALQAKRRRVVGASFAATAARRFWLSSQQQQQQQKPSAEAPPMDTAAQSPTVPAASQGAAASLQRSAAATAAAAAFEAQFSASNDLGVEHMGSSASRNHGANSKNTDSSNSGLSLVHSASSNNSFDLRALRRQCYRADAGPLLQSVTSLSSANRRSSRKRRSKSPVAIPTAATSPTLVGVGSSKAPPAAAASENEEAATTTPASGKEQQQQEQQLSPRSRAHQQLSPLLLHGQLLQQEQQLRSPLLLYPPQQQEQQQEEQQQDGEALRREGEVAVGGSHTAPPAGLLRAPHEGTIGGPGNFLEATHGQPTPHADGVSNLPTASEAAHVVAGVLPSRAEVSKAAAVVADAPSKANAGAALPNTSSPPPAQMATTGLQGVTARPSSVASSRSSGGSVASHAGGPREEAQMWSHAEVPSQRSPPSPEKAAVSSPAVTSTVASEPHTGSTAGLTRSAATPAAGAAGAAAREGQIMAQRAASLEPAARSAAAATAAPARITTSPLSATAAAQAAEEAIAAVSTAATVAAAAATTEAAVLTVPVRSAAEAAATAAAPTPGFPAARPWPASVDILSEPPGETPRAPPASPSSRIDSPTRSIDGLHHQPQQRTQKQQWVRQQQLGQTETEVQHTERVETESQGQGKQPQQEQAHIHASATSHQQRLQPLAEDQQQQELQQKRQPQAHPQQQHQSQQQPQEDHQPQQEPQQQHQPRQQPQQQQQQFLQKEHQQQLRLIEGQPAEPRNEDFRRSQLQQQRQQREQQPPIQQQPEQQQPHEQQPQQQHPEQQLPQQQLPQQQHPHQLRPQQPQPHHRPSQEDKPLQQRAQPQQPQQLQQQQEVHQQRAQQLQPQQDQPQQQLPHRRQRPQQQPQQQQLQQQQPQQQQPQQQQPQQQQPQQQQPQHDQSSRQKSQQQQSEQQQQRLQQREAPQGLQQHVALLRSAPLAEPLAASQPSDLSPRRGHRHSESGAPPPPELAAAHARQQQSSQQHRSPEHQQPRQQQPQQHLQQSTGEISVRRGGCSNLGSLRPVPPPFRPSRLVSPAADGDAIHTQFPLLGHAPTSSNSSVSTVSSSNSSSSSSSSRGPRAAQTAEHRPDTIEDLSVFCSNDNITAASSSSASFWAASRNPSGGAQRPVVAPASVDVVRNQQRQQQEQHQQLQQLQHLTLQEQHELVASVPSPAREMRASHGNSPVGHLGLFCEGSESLTAISVPPVVPDTSGAAAMAADVGPSQARAQQPQREQLMQHRLQENPVDLEAAESEASPLREGAFRQPAGSGSFEKALTSSDKGSRPGYTQAEEAASESHEGFAGADAGEQHQLLREVPSLRRGRSPDSSARKRPRRIFSPPPSPFTSASSSNSNFSSSSPWAAATAAIATRGRRAASAGLRRLYSAARVRLRRLSQGASKWAGALVASALLAAAGPLNQRLVGQLARALPPSFTKLPDFARRELGACEVRRSPGCSRISPRILAGRPTVSEAQEALRIAAAAEAAGEASEGVEWCIVQLAAPATIYGLDILTVQEAEPLYTKEDPANTQGVSGPPFFVEGLRAKPAVDGSLELTDCFPGQANAAPRTVVLRLRVHGQVALGPPPPALEAKRASNQQQQECWPPGVIEDVTNLLHGAAVVAGPSTGVWTPQTKQELLYPGSSLRPRKRASSRSRCSDASSRYSSSSSRYSNCSSSVDVRGDCSEVRPLCEGPEVWVVRLSSRCCLRRVEFARQPASSSKSGEADEGVVYELHGLEAPRELADVTLLQEIREMQELDDLPWQPLARAEFPPDEMHPTLSLAWDDPTCGNAGKPPPVTHVRVVCSQGSDLRRLRMWGIRLPPRAPQGY